MEDEPIHYLNRENGTIETENVLGGGMMRWAYLSPIRGALRWPLFGCACFSRLIGWYLDRRISCRRIDRVVKELNIPMDEAVIPEGGFANFNEFFARHLKDGARPLPADEMRLSSPADCRLTVYPELKGDTVVPVKGATYTVAELLGKENAGEAQRFANGSLMVCRLCPADYHRYHIFDDGEVLSYTALRGKYHSVNPLPLRLCVRVFSENLRTCALLKTAHCGVCAYIPVGAFGVASIHDGFVRPGQHFRRGDEAGYFQFGGSTIIVVFEAGRVVFDQDLITASAQGIETLVKANSAIGHILCLNPR